SFWYSFVKHVVSYASTRRRLPASIQSIVAGGGRVLTLLPSPHFMQDGCCSRRSAVSLEIPEKKQYALCDFKLKLAFSLTASGKDLRKKRGRPSTDAVKVNFEKKKKCGRATKPIPEDDIRKDGIGHFPAFSANRATCKLPGCKKQSAYVLPKM
ncbi:hypothetical protein O3P69_011713, partial [Scylla paramamosain]